MFALQNNEFAEGAQMKLETKRTQQQLVQSAQHRIEFVQQVPPAQHSLEPVLAIGYSSSVPGRDPGERDKQRERKRQKDKETDKQKDKKTEIHTEAEAEGETTVTESETETSKRKREKDKERHRERNKEWDDDLD